MFNSNVVQLAKPTDHPSKKLSAIVEVKCGRFAHAWPRCVHIVILQPFVFGQHRMIQAKSGGQRSDRIQRDVKPDNHSAERIQRHRDIGSSDAFPVLFIDHHDVQRGVIDLY